MFHTLAENLPNYLALYSAAGRFVYLNAKLEALLDIKAEEVVGRKTTQVFPDGRFDAFERQVLQTARTGRSSQMELLFATTNEQQVIHHVTFVAKHDETGAATYVLTIWHDLTERRQADAERQAQFEEILRLDQRFKENARELNYARSLLFGVLQTMPDMVWLKDTNGAYLLCNHAFKQTFCKQEFEVIGKTDYDLFDAKTADLFFANDRVAIRARCICINEEWGTNARTGKRVLFEKRTVPLFDDENNVTGVLGVGRDITERRCFEDKLAGREREFRTLVENSPDTVARYDRDFRRRYANPTFAMLVEGGATSLIGKKPSECPGGPNAAVYEEKLGEVFASGTDLEFELRWGKKDGGDFCHLIKLAPELAADGTVESVLAVGRDITELYTSRQKINQLAFYDSTTALPNRALFNERLLQMTADASWARYGLIGVMMIDLDRLKRVNDAMGHAVGDELLRQAANRLRACVRSCDTVARIGGDEFAVLLPGIPDRRGLEDIARSMIDRVDEGFALQGREVFISCSIGIALYPTDSVNAEDLVQYADLAMYRVKRSGRRNFCFYSKALTVDARMHLQLDSELRRAIQRSELALHYQPKVKGDGEVIGSEALLRWQRKGVGFISPQQFIPIAEETGLIVDLGKWVLREACHTAAEWNAEGTAPHKVSVNLSARQFRFFDLASTLNQILIETGCLPEWLELEITESLLLEDDEAVLGTLSALKSMGLSISIDDFGTGYSALSYLTRFPIDTLKIDQSFVQKVTTDQRHAELVKAILSIARCLGLQVVAEGVETAEQEAFLHANGCWVAQGFLYSQPLPKSEMALLLKQSRMNSAVAGSD